MLIYTYDGSFEGMLCAFQESLEEGNESAVFEKEDQSTLSLFPKQHVETHEEKARDFWIRVENLGGMESAHHLLLVYLSEVEGAESLLYDFLRLTFEQGRNLIGWYSHDAVRQVIRLKQKVTFETHRFTGLLRFQELQDGTFYAPFEPDHHIIYLLTPHFRSRMRNDKWVIHDCRRGLAIGWNGADLFPVEAIPDNIQNLMSRSEQHYQNLWRLFTQTISIQSRTNPRLQRQFMPRRYWKHLTEKSEVL